MSNIEIDLLFRNFLPSVPPNFKGREEEEAFLFTSLPKSRLYYLYGEAGIGKTTFLAKFLKEKSGFKKIVYYKCVKTETLDALLRQITGCNENYQIAELFQVFNEKFREESHSLFIDDLYYLEKSELKIFLTFLGNYYQGFSRIFLVSRACLDQTLIDNPTFFTELYIKSLSEKISLALIKELFAEKKIDKKQFEKIHGLSKGNPFLINQFALAGDFAEIDLSVVYRKISEKILTGLSDAEKEFVCFYSVLDFDLPEILLKECLISKSNLEKLLSSNLLELQGNNFFHLSDLLKSSVLKSLTGNEKAKYLRKVTAFLEDKARAPKEFLLLAIKYSELQDWTRVSEILAEKIDFWLKNDLNLNVILSLFNETLGVKGKGFVSRKILNQILLALVRKDNYPEIIKLILKFENEESFYPLLYWFLGIAYLEEGYYEEAAAVAEKLLNLETPLLQRGQLLKGRLHLKKMETEKALKIFKKLSESFKFPYKDATEVSLLKNTLYNLADLYNDSENFLQALIVIKQLRELLTEDKEQKDYNQFLTKLNYLYFKLKVKGVEEKDQEEINFLEQKADYYFFYNLKPVFTTLKTEYLLKRGSFRELIQTGQNILKTEFTGREKISKEEGNLLLNLTHFFIFFENWQEAEKALKILECTREPLHRLKALSLKKILTYLKEGVTFFEKGETLFFQHLFSDNSSETFQPVPNFLRSLKEGDSLKALSELEEVLESHEVSGISPELFNLLNLALLLSIRGYENQKTTYYFKKLKTLSEKTDQLPLKFEVLISLYSLLFNETSANLPELRRTLLRYDIPLFLRHLILYLFQQKPEYVFEEVLQRLNQDFFKLTESQKRYFDFYFSSFQLNIREDFELLSGNRKSRVNIFDFFKTLLSNRGIIINLTNQNIYAPDGKLWLSKSRQPLLYDLFLYLIVNKGKEIGKEELITQVWKKKYFPEADDESIYSNFKRLRKEIGDEDRKLIELINQNYIFSKTAKTYIVSY